MRRPCTFKLRLSSGNYTEYLPGWLLAWGSDYEELRDGVGQFPVAIIECDDGDNSVVMTHVENVRLKPQVKEDFAADIMARHDQFVEALKA